MEITTTMLPKSREELAPSKKLRLWHPTKRRATKVLSQRSLSTD
jgi:hypothetical protein